MRILLINPPSGIRVYSRSKIRVAVTKNPFIALAMIGASAKAKGHDVRVFDMMVDGCGPDELTRQVRSFEPDIAGVTFATPLAPEAYRIAQMIKNQRPETTVVAGGPHPSALPETTLTESVFDLGVIGEGENVINQIAQRKKPDSIPGLVYRHEDLIRRSAPAEFIADLDSLPMPAWELYDVAKYDSPNPLAQNHPVGFMETSRGCKYNCSFCCPAVFGRSVRFKSPQRVVDEFFHLREHGFKDVLIRDSNFTFDLNRAKQICNLLIENRAPLPWNLYTGVRVNEVDREFFDLAKASGCYSVSFGIESGDDQILKAAHKGQKAGQSIKAVNRAYAAGLDTVGFFMFGLPGETLQTMKATTQMAKSMNLDFAKVTMTVPFPGTAMYRQLDKAGKIKTKDWAAYNFHLAGAIFDHENLSWKTIEKFYKRFYRSFYLRPSYIARRLSKSIKRGRLLADIAYALRTRWL